MHRAHTANLRTFSARFSMPIFHLHIVSVSGARMMTVNVSIVCPIQLLELPLDVVYALAVVLLA